MATSLHRKEEERNRQIRKSSEQQQLIIIIISHLKYQIKKSLPKKKTDYAALVGKPWSDIFFGYCLATSNASGRLCCSIHLNAQSSNRVHWTASRFACQYQGSTRRPFIPREKRRMRPVQALGAQRVKVYRLKGVKNPILRSFWELPHTEPKAKHSRALDDLR